MPSMFWRSLRLKMSKKEKRFGPLLKIAGIVFPALFIICILVILMVNILMKEVLHNRKEVIIPDIVGLTINDALTVLGEKRLSMEKVADKYDTEIPAGSIISQSPPPGLTVREGKAVEAVISSGGKVVFVPEIENKSLRQAELMLRQAGLVMGEQTRTYSSTVKRDFVVSQDPDSGKVVEKNSYINIVVSKGPAEEEKIKKMPNILGRSMREAELTIKELGLDIKNITTTINDKLQEGTVIGQSPKQGEIIDKNTKVEIEISRFARSTREVRDETIYYEVTQSGKERKIKLVIEDDIGERVVFESFQEGGSKIEIPVKVLGTAKVSIFVDGILTKEQEIEFGEESDVEENDNK